MISVDLVEGITLFLGPVQYLEHFLVFGLKLHFDGVEDDLHKQVRTMRLS